MKKFLLVLIVLLLISVALPAVSLADGFDFSSMSLEELLGLRNAVDEEIRARVSTPSAALYNGVYIVGKDIKPGRYLLTVLQPVVEEKSRLGYVDGKDTTLFYTIDYAEVYIEFADGEDDILYLHAGESMILDLTEGTVMTINDVISATLTEAPQTSYIP